MWASKKWIMEEDCSCRFIGCLDSERGWCDKILRSENRASVFVDIERSPCGQSIHHSRRRTVNAFQSIGSCSNDSLFRAKTIVISQGVRSKLPREINKGEAGLNDEFKEVVISLVLDHANETSRCFRLKRFA